MGILIFSAILFLFAFPLGEFSRISPTLTRSFTLLDILVVTASFIWLGRQIILRKAPKTFQAKSFLAVLVIFALSLFINVGRLSQQQLITAGLYIVRFFSYGSLFFSYKDMTKKGQKTVLLLLFIGGLLLLLGGYLQYFFYPSLRDLIYFGWDEHFYRMFGTFFDPNFFGLFLSLFFLYVAWLLFRFWPARKKIFLWGLVFILLATFIGILLTYSRTALLALAAGLFILFWKKEQKRVFAAGFLIVVVVVVGFFAISNTKTDMNSLFRATSTDARFGSARNALLIFSDNPILGVGFNAYRYAQYRHHFMLGSPIQEDHGASGADSSMLLVLATSGIIGFGVFCLFLWSHVRVLLVAKNRLGLATATALFVGSFFVNGLFYPLLLVWAWPLLGIIESNEG